MDESIVKEFTIEDPHSPADLSDVAQQVIEQLGRGFAVTISPQITESDYEWDSTSVKALLGQDIGMSHVQYQWQSKATIYIRYSHIYLHMLLGVRKNQNSLSPIIQSSTVHPNREIFIGSIEDSFQRTEDMEDCIQAEITHIAGFAPEIVK